MVQKLKHFLFRNTTTRQTVAKNTFWLAVSNIGGRLIRAIVIIYAARVLGAAGWGVFSYAVTLASFLTLFTDVGLSQVLIRETAKQQDPERRATVLSTTFGIKLALLALGIAVILFAAPYFTTIPGARAILPLVAFLLAFDTLREFGFAFIRALERMEWEAGLFLLTNVAIVAFGVTFLTASPTVGSFTYAYTIGTGIGTAATFFVLRRHFRGLFSHFSKDVVKPIFASAWPLSIAALLGLLMLNTDIIIIGWLRSAEDVGFYSAANRIIQLLYLLPAVLATSAFPTFSRLAQRDNTRMRQILERTVSVSFLASLPIAAGGIIFAPAILSLVFGPSFLPGTASFQILIATLVIDFPMVLLSNAIFAYNRQKNLTVYSAIGGITNVVFDFLFIPVFGITGSAWATLIAQLASNLYLWRAMKRINRFSVLPRLKKVIAATALMSLTALVLASLRVEVVLAVLLSAAIYFAALKLLDEPFIEEVRAALRPAAIAE